MAKETDVYELLVVTTGVQELKTVEKELVNVGEAAKGAGKKIEGATADMKTARAGVVDLSRAAQDFAQGGFPAIVNNLEGVGRGLTSILANPIAMVSSLPALMTVAGVAILALGDKLATLGATIQDQWNPDRIKPITSEVEKLNAQIKELKDKSVKLAVDVAEIDTAEKKLKELLKLQTDWEARQKGQTPGEAEAGKLTKERLEMEKGGISGVQTDLKRKLVQDFTTDSTVLNNIAKEMAAAAQGYARDQMTGERMYVGRTLARNYERLLTEQGAQERQRIEKSAQDEATRLLNAPIEGHGPAAAQGRKVLGRELRRIGRGGLAADIEGTTPEALEATDKADKVFADANERAKASREVRQKKAAEAARESREAAQKAREATAEQKKAQAAIDRHTDIWAQEGEEFIADRERAAKAAPRVAKQKAQQEQEAQTTALAQNIQRMAPRFEGIQFTPAQAKAAADQAMKSMEQQINADQAILMAMDGILNTMAKAGNRFANVQMQAVRAARQANGMGDFFDQQQPGAGNVGGGGG